MVRARCLLELGQVAAGALRGSTREVSFCVALRALRLSMGSGQGECRLGVIELCALPGRGRVAHFAVLWEARRNVIRVGCFAELRHVAARTMRRRRREIVADVALQALRGHVCAGQGESAS